MKRILSLSTGLGVALTLSTPPALAHDPVFGLGPHVLYKGGVETAVEVAHDKAGEEKGSELALELTYGITGDWAAGFDIPYAVRKDDRDSSRGLADLRLFTKYRFWRADSLGVQESAAVMLAVNGNNADNDVTPPLGNGATDVITGLTYGYESIRWYRWASLRYLLPGENDAGLRKGRMLRMDIVGGWRPEPPVYKKPDTVWLLELNGEITERATLEGTDIADSGGTEWFVAPGIFWTLRNFAIKSGIQIPLASRLNGDQDATDYRFKATFEWHL